MVVGVIYETSLSLHELLDVLFLRLPLSFISLQTSRSFVEVVGTASDTKYTT